MAQIEEQVVYTDCVEVFTGAFAYGPSGYKLLLSQEYPLPAIRTLCKSLERIRFDRGLLKEVFESFVMTDGC